MASRDGMVVYDTSYDWKADNETSTVSTGANIDEMSMEMEASNV